MTQVTHKRGDTLRIVCQLTDDDGDAINLAGLSIASQIRQSNDRVVADLTVTVLDAADGKFELSAVTDEWPTGRHLCDIEYTQANGDVFSTVTFDFLVVRDITRAN